MNKFTLFFATLALTLTLNAQTGNTIYKAKCAVCHTLKPMMDKNQMMNMSQKNRMAMMQKMMKTMKAPPMNKVSAKLKDALKNDKKAFIAFVSDYIVNPSAEKAHCMPMALKRFGTMPPIGKMMSKKDINIIATWLFENFNDKWDMNERGMLCNSQKHNKCGKRKCGECESKQKHKHQCACLKCAEKKTSSMKCGQGKCGGK